MLRLDGKKDKERRQHHEDANTTVHIVGAEGDIYYFKEYRKTTTTFAARIDEPFEVDTLEGVHTGKPGDWLAVGQAGEMYPIDAAVFAATYEEA